jgi:hypothetical protein
MKTNLTRTLILSAVALAGTGAAFAEDNVSAEIPFAFRAAGVKFDAGVYSISQYGHVDSGVITLQNRQGRNAKFVNTTGPLTGAGGDRMDRNPRLIFRCGDTSGCALSAVHLENGRTWTLRIPRLKAMETEHIALIHLDRNQSE